MNFLRYTDYKTLNIDEQTAYVKFIWAIRHVPIIQSEFVYDSDKPYVALKYF